MVVRLYLISVLLSLCPHVLCEEDPSEYGWYRFFYNHNTHKFYVIYYEPKVLKCYIAALTSNELLSVHTDQGLRALEVKMLSLVGQASQIKPRLLDQHDANTCNVANKNHNFTMYYFKLI